MLNIKSKKLCLVKCKFEHGGGITYNKIYRVVYLRYKCVCIYNDYGILNWYSKEYFEEVKSNEQK